MLCATPIEIAKRQVLFGLQRTANVSCQPTTGLQADFKQNAKRQMSFFSNIVEVRWEVVFSGTAGIGGKPCGLRGSSDDAIEKFIGRGEVVLLLCVFG